MDFIKKISFVFVALYLIGCKSAPPAPFGPSSEQPRIEMRNFNHESDQILNISLMNLLPIHGKDTLSRNCISRSERMPTGASKSAKYCFSVDFSSQTIKRINATNCIKTGIVSGKSYRAQGENCGYTFILSGIANAFTATELTREYNKNSDKFLSYYKGYIDYRDRMFESLKKLTVAVDDKTDVLSENELATASKFSWRRNNANLVRASQTNADYGEVFKASARWDSTGLDKRFALPNPRTFFDVKPDRQDAVIFEIDAVQFNYVPTVFEIGDEKLNVVAKSTLSKDGYLRDVELSFINKTNSFLKVIELAGYFNGKVISDIVTQKGDPISLPPQSMKSVIMSRNQVENLYGTGILDVKNREQKVPYGFSLQYLASDDDDKIDIYKVNDVTIDQILY